MTPNARTSQWLLECGNVTGIVKTISATGFTDERLGTMFTPAPFPAGT
jgi:hypothetical protein